MQHFKYKHPASQIFALSLSQEQGTPHPSSVRGVENMERGKANARSAEQGLGISGNSFARLCLYEVRGEPNWVFSRASRLGSGGLGVGAGYSGWF